MANGTWTEMKKSLKKSALIALLVPFLASPIQDADKNFINAFQRNIKEQLSSINYEVNYANSGSNASHYKKYYEKISPLITHLEEKGFQVSRLLQDPRFEIYEETKNRFTYSAERKSPSLNEYKIALGYDSKKNEISNFIEGNIDQLELAEQTYGIPKQIISAIIGVESDFGVNLGDYNPFNAYFSMYANNYKKEFASTQLEELLIFCEKHDIGVFSLKSSYAGAISYAQFLPYSLNQWFIGSDLYDMDNNILSVANYLSHFKKRTGNLEKAIFRYNPSNLYVKTILNLAKDAEEIMENSKF